MLSVKLIHNSTYDCLGESIASVLDYYKKDYVIMYLDSWELIEWNQATRELMENGIATYGKVEKVKKIYNANISVESFSVKEELLEYIQENISLGIPVILGTDSYKLYWSENYRKIHDLHALVVTGMSDASNEIFVTDCSKVKEGIKLDLDEILPGIVQTLVINFNNNNEEQVDVDNVLAREKEALKVAMEKNNYIENMKILANQTIKNKEFIDMLESDKVDIKNNTFIMYLHWISRCRFSFSEALKHIDDKEGTKMHLEVSEGLNKVASKLQLVRNLFIKYIISGDLTDNINEISKKFMDAIDSEYSIYTLFLNQKINELVIDREQEDYENLKAQEINIKHLFNNNAFDSDKYEDREENLGFDGKGYFYVSNTKDEKEKISLENMKIEIDTSNYYDNISCNGQEIEDINKNIKYIDIIGSAEQGIFSDDCILIYDDCEKRLNIDVTDWWDKSIFYNEKVVWNGICGEISSNNYESLNKVSIFSKKYTIDEKRKLKSIILPKCSNMHIFSIVIYEVIK